MDKQTFLVSYDYGGGGLWGAIIAPNEESINEKYPELVVVQERPRWMSKERYEQICNLECHDIDGAVWGILNAVVADRQRPTSP
jgi:hypothetical protein